MLFQLVQQSATLQEGHRDILRRIGHLEQQQRELLGQIERWKGALPIVLFFGALIGWFLSSWQALRRLFGAG